MADSEARKEGKDNQNRRYVNICGNEGGNKRENEVKKEREREERREGGRRKGKGA